MGFLRAHGQKNLRRSRKCDRKQTQLQHEALEQRELLTGNAASTNAAEPSTVLISGKQSEVWSVTGYDLASEDTSKEALPWVNLNTIEVAVDESDQLSGREMRLYGTKDTPDSAAAEISTDFVGQSDGFATWSFSDLERGHYLLDLGDQQIQFSVLPGNAVSEGANSRVGFGDFARFARSFGEKSTTLTANDFDGDGAVRFSDFGVLGSNFGLRLPSSELAPTPDDIYDFDFGDAPDSESTKREYHTLFVNDGARHRIVDNGPILGATIDHEVDGQPSDDARGDDGTAIEADDEDGLLEFRTYGTRGEAVIEVTAELETTPLLDGWMDFNGDGDWDDDGEQIFKNQPVEDGINELEFDVPEGALTFGLSSAAADGQGGTETFLRLRLSTAGDLTPSGPAADGEVEDYAINAVPYIIDIPEDSEDPIRDVAVVRDEPEEKNEEDPRPELTEISRDEGLPDDFVGTELPENALEERSVRPITEILNVIKAAEAAGAEAGLDILQDELRDARKSEVTDIQVNQLLKMEGEERDAFAERIAREIVELRGLGDRFPYAQLIKKMLLDTPHGQPCEFKSFTIRIFPDDSMQMIFQDQNGGFRAERAYFGNASDFNGESTGSGLIVESPTSNPNEFREGSRSREYLPGCRRLNWGNWERTDDGAERIIELQGHDPDLGWVTEASEVGEVISAPNVQHTWWSYRFLTSEAGSAAALDGATASVKAASNGVFDGVYSFVTLGTHTDAPDLFELSDSDRRAGTDTVTSVVSTGTGVFLGLAGGTGNVMARGILLLDFGNNGLGIGRNLADIQQNGATAENVFGLVTSGLGTSSNASDVTKVIDGVN